MGVELFSGGVVKMFISIETYRTYDFLGGDGPDPIPPLDQRMYFFLEFKYVLKRVSF